MDDEKDSTYEVVPIVDVTCAKGLKELSVDNTSKRNEQMDFCLKREQKEG